MNGPTFITGGSGLLALSWAMALRDRHPVTLGLHTRVVALAGVATHRAALDSVDGVLQGLDAISPALVVHAAALTDVEICEANPALAQHVNVELAANVAAACARRRVPLVHISTDHVFHGNRALVAESEPTDPQNTYARTKANAERRVLEACPSALVVRTNFFGWGTSYRRSFSDRVLDALRARMRITLFTDAFYTPMLATAVSASVHDLVVRGATGIVHVVGDERISKYDFGVQVAEAFGLDAGLIDAGRLADTPGLVRRPLDMSLSNEQARRLLGRPLGLVREHVAALRDEFAIGHAETLRHV